MKGITTPALLLILVGSATACSGPGAAARKGPAQVVLAYSEALEGRRYKDAYLLMSADFRKRNSLAGFTRMVTRDPKTAARVLSRLRAQADRLQVSAAVQYGDSETIRLSSEKGEWRIAEDPTDIYSQRTPREALRSFVRALEQRRYDIVLRFVPARWAKDLTRAKLKKAWEGKGKDALETLIANLKANLDGPFKQSEDRATMAYGEGFKLKMVREESLWKVSDPD